ncbi:hypothetical protein ES703_94493 [subsurface metagenome]
MGKSVESKLERADFLNKTATKIRKKDPENARSLDDLARTTRRTAIRQLKRRPKHRKTAMVI